MPSEIDKRETARQIRRLFPPLALKNYLCERCIRKEEKQRAKLEAEWEVKRAKLPPHMKDAAQPVKSRSKRSHS